MKEIAELSTYNQGYIYKRSKGMDPATNGTLSSIEDKMPIGVLIKYIVDLVFENK